MTNLLKMTMIGQKNKWNNVTGPMTLRPLKTFDHAQIMKSDHQDEQLHDPVMILVQDPTIRAHRAPSNLFQLLDYQ